MSTSNGYSRLKARHEKLQTEFNKLVDMVTEMMGVKAAEQIKQFELTNLQFDWPWEKQ